ncbi:MAG: hypothetical protein BAA01_00400 [Bacillus thermozeamaize]|uniref:Penicillin-binding protein transpeptidase domain-containing protein n=1 Tax=Bacillus thermozeamaize TaxID=230954 RepID=A0A1Y3PU68_9BACI|nr:MAG: hypothetical protein BAA01_00400 [Bacillus thermozeamaize]
MFRHRFFLLALLFFSALLVLLYRLYLIQIGEREHFGPYRVNLAEAARRQQEKVLIAAPLRGAIVDRQDHSLLGEPQKGALVFPDAFLSAQAEDWRKAAAILQWPLADLRVAVEELDSPGLLRFPGNGRLVYLTDEQARLLAPMRRRGIAVVSLPGRYGDGMIAKHVIGFVSQDPKRVQALYAKELEKGLISLAAPVGQAGLERAFEPFLQDLTGTSMARVVYTIDGRGQPLFGGRLGLEEVANGDSPPTVRTTLYGRLQRTVEQALDEAKVEKGAAVVLDVRNGDILAMASRPDFDPRAVDPQSASWNNYAVKQTVPGSIFKVVVAAAALEEGLVAEDTPFVCPGELEKYHFSCWKKEGHGKLTFAEGFAQSCNIVFAQLALQLGGDKLAHYAKELGLLQPVGWRGELFRMGTFAQIDGEEPGQLFSAATPRTDGGVLVQTAIGQRDVQMTPLQAAHLMATIANDGRAMAPRLVQSLLYHNGQTMAEFKIQAKPDKPLSGETIRCLQRLLRKVVEEGTGRPLQAARWPLAGKSGTGEYVKGKTDNQWFIGYGPADEPRVAVAVVSMDTPADEKNKAIQVFRKIMDWLAARESMGTK